MEASDSVLQKKGWALKKADVIPQWNKRYLVCDPYTCHLLYYREKPADIGTTIPRGSLDLTKCSVNITSGAEPEEQQCRFTITSCDQKQTYNLQVGDRKELYSWYDAIDLLSKLGAAREQVAVESMGTNKVVLLLASQKLLRGLERKSSECQDGLQKVADEKWKAKCRLMELLKQLKKGETVLQDKFLNLQLQEKELREKMHFLIQKEFFLQDEVSKSNNIQEKVVEAFYAEGKSLDKKALAALKLCTPGPEDAPCESPRNSKRDTAKLYETADGTTDSGHGKGKKSLPTPTNFREEMVKVLLLHFPSLLKNLQWSLSYLKQQGEDCKEGQYAVDSKEELAVASKMSDTERTLLFFHSYFTKVHVAQEERLIQVRTQCQAKFHKLKWINRQRDLISRETSELQWIISEMKRAITRLTKEGVPLGPGEVDADIGRENLVRDKSVKDTLVPIRAHRATWSEASDVIFKLNFNRQEQNKQRKELEGALTTRESIKEFLGTIENTDEEHLEGRMRLVQSITLRRDSRRDLGIKKYGSDHEMKE